MEEYEKKGWIDNIHLKISRVTMLLPAAIVVIMMLEVCLRYIFEKPTIWVNEMSLWMGGWVYLSSGLYAMQQRSHIRIFILYDIVPLWLKRVFDLISTLFIVLWCGAVVYGGFGEAWEALVTWERFGTAWDPPIPAITQPLIIIVVALVTIQAVSNLITDWNVNDKKLKKQSVPEY